MPFKNYSITKGGALTIPQIYSPNFNLANPSASPSPSWALLKSGILYAFGLVLSGGTINGPDYIINSSGVFFYSGAPANGNLIVSMAGASGTDAFGNAYPQGFFVNTGQIAGGIINAGTVGTVQIANSAITNALLATGSVQAANLNVAAGKNLIIDPGFSITAMNVLRTTDSSTTGTWSISGGVATNSSNLSGQRMALTLSSGISLYVTPGEQYYVSVGVAITASGGSTNAGIRFRYQDGTTSDVTATVSTTSFTTVSGTITIPAGKTSAQIFLLTNNGSSSGVPEYQAPLVYLTNGTNEIQASAITAAKIAANTITAAQIAANTITAGQIAANTITASQIAAGTITAAQIAANTITASQIAANTITAAQIAANTITAAQIAANTITASQIAANTITAAQIAAATITGTQIAASISLTTPTINGTDFVLNSSGEFYYTGAPAAGNLSVSMVPGTTTVTDAHGNVALAGFTVYLSQSGKSVAVNISQPYGSGGIAVYLASSQAGPWTISSALLSYAVDLAGTDVNMAIEAATLTFSATSMQTLTPLEVTDGLILDNISQPAQPGGAATLYASSGHQKYVSSSEGNAYNTGRLTSIINSPVTGNNTGAFTTVTSIPVAALTYKVRAWMLIHGGANAGTGRLNLNGPTTSQVALEWKSATGTTTPVYNELYATTLGSFASQTLSTTDPSQLVVAEGTVTFSASGTLTLRCQPITSNADTIIVDAGSYLEVEPVT